MTELIKELLAPLISKMKDGYTVNGDDLARLAKTLREADCPPTHSNYTSIETRQLKIK